MSKIYPLIDHGREYDKRSMHGLDKMIESVKEEGVREPVITHNRKDNGTYQVCIGCQRYFAAKRNNLKYIMCIVNCLEGQKYIPDGERLFDAKDIAQCFKEPRMRTLCFEPLPNPHILGLQKSGEQAFQQGKRFSAEGGVFCAPK